MKEDKLNQLLIKRQYKVREYNSIPSSSWRKRLKKLEIELIDGNIKIERLKRQYQ